MRNKSIFRVLQERFGDPIGNYAGDSPAGVRDVGPVRCPTCGMEDCECQHSMSEGDVCSECGMMAVEGTCGCTYKMAEAKKKEVFGPIFMLGERHKKGRRNRGRKVILKHSI